MKRAATDVIRRGFDNAVANWPLLLFRFAEHFLFAMLILASVFAVVVPVVISAGFSNWEPGHVGDAAAAVLDFLRAHAIIIVYVFVVVTVLGFVLIAVHSFVVGGIARVLVDAERTAAESGRRDRFRRFTVERWFAGGRTKWWAVFWIYNLAYGLAALIVCIPLLAIIALFTVSILAESSGGAIATGCLGLPIVVFLAIAGSLLAAVWSQKAIVVCVDENRGARDALRAGWREARADFSRHFAVAFVMFVIAVGGSGVISMISFGFSTPTFSPHGPGPLIGLAFMPARIATTFLSSVFGSAVSIWSLASFAALSERP